MIIDGPDMKYVIGFPIKEAKVLLIRRNKHPWINKWNGAGGKIEQGENPLEAIQREILEETTIDLKHAEQTRFVGIVTWDFNKEVKDTTAMYAFISYLSEEQPIWKEKRIISEGTLAWKSLEWTINKKNKEVADNIPYFLPLMIKSKQPMRYHCIFRNEVLKAVEELQLPTGIKLGSLSVD